MFNKSMPPGVIIPVLHYEDLETAVTWLTEVVGFVERLRIGNHRSQLLFNGASVVAAAQGGLRPDETHPTHSIMVVVEDVNRHFERVKAAGGKALGEPADYPFGERQYSVADPGGHVWTFSQSTADVDPAVWGGKLLIQ